jgi:hypothetical protein
LGSGTKQSFYFDASVREPMAARPCTEAPASCLAPSPAGEALADGQNAFAEKEEHAE